MDVTLQDITEENFEDFMDMELPEHQRELLASNAYSIAQSRFYPDYIPRGVYCDGEPAGFLLYDRRAGDVEGDYAIYRFMVDHARQGRGIGRRAMELLLAELRARPDMRRITICYHERNARAKAFYASFGFVETGVDERGEMVAELRA
ncbi:GNAT family N-acetyltransferase [Massilia sp. YIM B02763]|uniref:GNAT family N-acetyltransferase n=1 Tax=Massilia sp. YIM B02763 TaxID=3050130 RepID=UPI0025B6AC15|nr:GNAT family N-acetyltransferase [Massilia sp. YIM B02763]MDN4055898.1 GNAT family N-acetyltransferase [Massilia sp. YIM B02763]